MIPPIIVAEGWDLKLYGSQQDAELDLEPADVEVGRYVAYDSEGRLLKVEAKGPAVTLLAVEAAPTHQEQLRELLRGALVRTGHNPEEADSLKRLIETSQIFTFKPPRTTWETFRGLFRK